MKKRSKLGLIIGIFTLVLVLIGVYMFTFIIPEQVFLLYGEASTDLNRWQMNRLAIRLYLNQNVLLSSSEKQADKDVRFVVEQGQSAGMIADALASAGIIPDADLFLDYLIYKGYDRILQSGTYQLPPGRSAVEIAQKMLDPTPEDVTFVILPGMRFTEIVDLVPTSGLSFDSQELMPFYNDPDLLDLPQIFSEVQNLEGLILAGEYEIDRTLDARAFLQFLLDQTVLQFSTEVRDAFALQGFGSYQAIKLASIIEREAVQPEEKELISSVFQNRLAIGMPLQSDPTVQYALGWDPTSATWWKNPLSSADLQFESAYNTYINNGLPPTPICSVSIDSLISVAFPETSDYYYFRSACDGSGFHIFAKTYTEHQSNACP